MTFWQREPFPDLIKEREFYFSDHGPLHAPVKSFTLRRTKKLAIVLDTVCAGDAVSNEEHRAAGSLYKTESQLAQIEGINGMAVSLIGVIPCSVQRCDDFVRETSVLREEAEVSGVKAALGRSEPEVYTIDWLENVGGYYHWPDLVVSESKKIHTRMYGREPSALTLSDEDCEMSSGRSAIGLTIGGINIRLTVNKSDDSSEQIKPGYILYHGTPDATIRRKIRTILSFVLGMYLVHLGDSTYTADWKLAAFHAIRGYSMDMKAFDMPVLPPAFLGARAHNVLDVEKVSRMAEGLYAHYDELDFDNLSWGYWHAVCAPLHIKAVHLGAIIEALQRRYIASHPGVFVTKVMTAEWASFASAVNDLIDSLELPDDGKSVMRSNVGLLNQVPRRSMTEEVFKRIGLQLGPDEERAWKRRHDAAHGNPMVSGTEREVIRDSHLLRVIFHRMILGIVGGGDQYYDYASPEHPLRNLRDPVPPLGDM